MKALFRVVLVLALLLFPLSVQAQEVDEEGFTQQLLEESGAESIAQSLPESTQKLLEQQNLLPGQEGMEQLTPWGVLGLLCQGLGESLGQPLQIFLSAMGVILLYRLFSGFADTGLTDTRPLMNTVAVLCLCGVLLVPCIQFMEQTVEFLSQMGEFVAALTPVYAGLLAASGQAATALSWNTVLIGMVELMSFLASTFLIPLTGVFLALTVVGAAGGQLQLTGFAKTLKKVVLWVFGLLLTVFVGVLTIRSFVSSAADGVSLRTGKYLAGSMLPLVGGAVSDALGVLQGCLGKVTTSVGAFGILALLITFLPMILQVGLMQLSIKLSQGVAGLMEAGRLEGLLEGAGFVLTMLQALLICYGMMLLSALALLLTVGGQVWT